MGMKMPQVSEIPIKLIPPKGKDLIPEYPLGGTGVGKQGKIVSG
jgi:hypothetical protein